MKALDYCIIIACLAFFVASYLAENAELKALFSAVAVINAAWFGGRCGGRQYKKNQDKK